MPFKIDFAQQFGEVGRDLIPADESILGVVQAVPKGEIFRRAAFVRGGFMRAIPMNLEGEAAAWPHLFARNESKPGHWTTEGYWYFWIVITNKQLHVFEGRTVRRGQAERPGPEAARFPLERIDEIRFTKHRGVGDLSIWFKDGSSVQLDVGMQKLDPFLVAIRPFERSDSRRPPSPGWMPPIVRWSLALAVFVAGLALTAGAADEANLGRVLADRGQEATARVTGVDSEADSLARLEVEFRDDIGFSSETEVKSCDAVADTQVGDKLEVLYDPDDIALAHPEECDLDTQGPLWLLVPGIALIVLGTYMTIRVWRFSGWRRRRIGIPVAIFGLLWGATALTEADCYCFEFVYTGAALVIIGLVPQFAPRPVQPPNHPVTGRR